MATAQTPFCQAALMAGTVKRLISAETESTIYAESTQERHELALKGTEVNHSLNVHFGYLIQGTSVFIPLTQRTHIYLLSAIIIFCLGSSNVKGRY